MLFAARLNKINDQINSYQDEIIRLQQLISNLQQHSQQIQSAEQAAESAIAQISTALSMLNAIEPAEIETFKAAVLAEFEKPIATLPPAVDVDTNDSDEVLDILEPENLESLHDAESDGVESNDDGDDSDDDEVTTVDVEVETVEEVETTAENNGNGHYDSEPTYLSYGDLVKVSRNKLIKLAKGIVDRPQHQSAAVLAQVLADKGVTQADIDSLN